MPGPIIKLLPISKSSYINTNLSGKPEIFIYMSAESYGTKNAISLSFSTFSLIKNDEYRQKQPILPEIQKKYSLKYFSIQIQIHIDYMIDYKHYNDIQL